ncbi:MAG: response regulator transcription factor [Clostridia bacterium]|nr:response regulator transcription factor [Clostridia bacterium]
MEDKVWIIDDEKELADAIAKYFTMFGLSARAEYGISALQKIPIDIRVILLDINLGRDCGYDYIEVIRKRCPQAKILLISARSEERDMLRGYHLGADDYIIKPFSLQVMLCKVQKLLQDGEKTLEEYRGLSVDKDAMTITRDGVTQRLKNMEFKLFYYLFCNRGKVLDKDDIIRDVWGEGYYTDNTLNVHIRRIREKIEKYSGEFITTVWGVGYQFE